MNSPAFYPIGTPGQPWSAADVTEWRSRQLRHRSYAADVLSAIERLRARFDVVQYGRLDYPPDTYPLFAIKSRDWHDALPCALITGGVHDRNDISLPPSIGERLDTFGPGVLAEVKAIGLTFDAGA